MPGLGVIAACILVDRAGRNRTQVWLYSLCAVFTPVLGVALSYHAPTVLMVTAAFIARAGIMGASSVTWVYPAEVRAGCGDMGK